MNKPVDARPPLDILLTGIPRSGLTLAGALIDSFPNAVCLNNPKAHTIIAGVLVGRRHAYCKWVAGEFLWLRRRIQHGQTVDDFRAADFSHLLDGVYDTRYPVLDTGERNTMTLGWPDIAPNFSLAIKQHALYTALLPIFTEFMHFRMIAIVRHPVDVILSWQRLKDNPLSQGRLAPEIKSFWPKAQEISETDMDDLSRMVQLYELFCERYFTMQKQLIIIKYEDLLEDPGLISRGIGIKETSPIIHKIKHSARRGSPDIDKIRERLQQFGVFTKHFYPDF